MGGSGLRLNNDTDVNLESLGRCLMFEAEPTVAKLGIFFRYNSLQVESPLHCKLLLVSDGCFELN